MNREIRGATMIEAAVILPVFFLVLFLLVDFTRYIVVKATLIRGCQEGLDLASKLPSLEKPPFEIASDVTLTSDFLAARARVIAATTRLPLAVLTSAPPTSGTAPSSAMSELLELTFAGPGHPFDVTSILKDKKFAAALVRPGERYKIVMDNTAVDHPTAAFPDAAGDLSYANSLYDNPFMVVAYANFRFIVPFFPATKVRGKALGFREIYLRNNRQATPAPLSVDTTLVNPTYPPTTMFATTTTVLPATTAPPITIPPSPTTLCVPSASPCTGFGYWFDPINCACVCRPGRRSISGFCVPSGE